MGTQERDAAKNGVSAAESGDENELTIEELASRSGMTVRNIRSHRARGLLPPPEVRDRVGYYGPQHLTRLRMIQELQSEGFNLKGIERLLETPPEDQLPPRLRWAITRMARRLRQ